MMDPVSPVPDVAKSLYPDGQEVYVQPPDGVPENEVGVSPSLVTIHSGGMMDGCPMFHEFFRPTAEELEILNNGGMIELILMCTAMPPHAMGVISK
jgi:hypothetical protein